MGWGRPFTEEDKAAIWEKHQAGVPLKRIARELGRQNCAIREYVGRTGGIRPRPRDAMTKRIVTLPAQLRRTLTWDQGPEMSEHVRFTVDTGVQVYFCHPRSPWQRGTNENTNGLLRQYLPKGTDLSVHSQRQLDAIARSLNRRPRKTLGFMSPSEAFAGAVASTH
jgi:IS30 family transposase